MNNRYRSLLKEKLAGYNFNESQFKGVERIFDGCINLISDGNGEPTNAQLVGVVDTVYFVVRNVTNIMGIK